MARKKKATQEASRKKKRPAVPPPFIDHTWWQLLGIDWSNPEDPPTEHSLGTAYRQKAIKVHPDKHLERKAEYEAEFKKLNEVNEQLKSCFEVLRVLQQENPDVTVLSVTIRPPQQRTESSCPSKKRRRTESGCASGPSTPSSGSRPAAIPTAPGYNPTTLVPYSNIKSAVADIYSFLGDDLRFDWILSVLRGLRCHRHVEFQLKKDPDRPTRPWHRKFYHGTSWKGMQAIIAGGFLPSWGAGRKGAFKKFGEDRPYVYVSPEEICAARYPLALFDDNEPCGELVAYDVPYLRTMLVCNTLEDHARVRINRKKNNKQHGYLPEDVWPIAIRVTAMPTAPIEQVNHRAQRECSGAPEPADSSSYASAPGFIAPPLALPSTKDAINELRAHTVLARLRIHDGDTRRTSELASKARILLDMRADWCARNDIHNGSLSQTQLKSIWRECLKAMFEEEDDPQRLQKELDATRNKHERDAIKQAQHGRFNVWIRLMLGTKTYVAILLRYGVDNGIHSAIRALASSSMED